MRKLCLAVLFILTMVFLAGCGNDQPALSNSYKEKNDNQKINIVATFYPLYEFAGRVGGERVEVYNLLPPGVEPHGWEPTPRELARIEDADLFIYNGAGMEPWVEQRLLPVLKNSGVRVVNASSGQDLIHLSAGEQEAEHAHVHEGNRKYDPHFWLDPVMAKKIVESISLALISIDPSGEQYYRNNTENYTNELLALDREFSAAAKEFKNKELVTSHSAFAYLARRYGLQQVSVLGLSPDAQPSPAELKEVVNFVREKKVKCIFFEPLVNPGLAETVAREAKVKTGVLDPVAGLSDEEEARGENYISIMRKNLAALREALS
ncbi:metal ABC transporter substrate-binding protein [Desulfolucanica intricata]|uniref:metal ABC transporter substrate-binding protein n=1 Tax=Desulfolucanica intricata TaxID=1285191 RepID=UPI00082F1FFA|nr:metal ABC transporter substrate-binding protein [Desulfolucanica intricata]